jgi:hypothetical protein
MNERAGQRSNENLLDNRGSFAPCAERNILADYLIGKASTIEADTLEIPRPEDGFAKPDPALTAVGYAFRVRSRSYGGQVG